MAIEVGFDESTHQAIDPPTPPAPTETPQIPPSPPSKIPTEIVSDEEMSLIEAAFSFAFAARSTSTSLNLHRNPPSITSINLLSKRNSSSISTSDCVGDIEDGIGNGRIQKKKKITESLLYRFRRKSGLFVTDITSTEWCGKQQEFFLLCGKPKASKAMKAGSARHAVLEEEVITRVEVLIRSSEERWALKFINFIHGANQLFLEGLTREMPLVGFVEGVCVGGIIDEIQMTTITENKRAPTLIETKTRAQDNLPSEPQQRNARLQLMCYKYLWDNQISHPFPSQEFLKLFSLKPNYILSRDIQESAIQAGAPAKFDLRTGVATELFSCQPIPDRSFVGVVNLNSIAIDPRNPNLFAIAGSDEYTRLYDIRKYKWDGSAPFGKPADYFCPRHLINDENLGITGITFSNESELLVSYCDDFIYLFSKDMGLGGDVSAILDSCSSDSEMETGVESDGKVVGPRVYKGHRNCVTVKGVGFFGPKCEYVVSGSDCGRMFIWRKGDMQLVRVLEADKQVVNCIEPHPYLTVLASSGIERDIKIWTPSAVEKASFPASVDRVRFFSINCTLYCVLHALKTVDSLTFDIRHLTADS